MLLRWCALKEQLVHQPLTHAAVELWETTPEDRPLDGANLCSSGEKAHSSRRRNITKELLFFSSWVNHFPSPAGDPAAIWSLEWKLTLIEVQGAEAGYTCLNESCLIGRSASLVLSAFLPPVVKSLSWGRSRTPWPAEGQRPVEAQIVSARPPWGSVMHSLSCLSCCYKRCVWFQICAGRGFVFVVVQQQTVFKKFSWITNCRIKSNVHLLDLTTVFLYT